MANMPIGAMNINPSQPIQANQVMSGKKNIGSLFSGLDQNQQGLKNESISQALSLIQGGQSPLLQNQSNYARQNWLQNTVPTLAERFTSLGAGGGRSSAFQNQLAQSNQDFEGQQSQNFMQLLSLLLGHGLQDQNVFEKAPPGFLESFGGGLGQGTGVGLSLLLKYLTGGAS